ncbi:MAG TPA: hypothetical protein GXX29_02930 [Firmicutes bacterium]|nr:hypothetical protein [Bacillota bacterium]
MAALIALDAGTTSSKAAAWRLDGRLLANHSLRTPYTADAGRVTRRLDVTWSAFCTVIRQTVDAVHAAGEEVVAVGLTGHGNGLHLWNGCHFAPEAIGSADMRASQWLETYPQRRELEQRLSQRLYPGQTYVLLHVLASTDLPLFSKDWLGYQLCGEVATDFTDVAAGALCDLYGTPTVANLPPLLPSPAVRGYVTKQAAKETGLPAGIPVAVGCIDLAAAVLGCGCVQKFDRLAICGSWLIDLMLVPADVPLVVEPPVNLLPYVFPEFRLASAYTPHGTLALERLLQLRNIPASYQAIDTAVQQVMDTPPERFYHPEASMNENEMATAAVPDLLYMAFEGIAATHRLNLEALATAASASFCKHRPATTTGNPAGDNRPLAVTGGLSASAVWRQLLADLMGEPVESQGMEATCRGAAICAALAAKCFPTAEEAIHTLACPGLLVQPDQRRVPTMEARYQRWLAARPPGTAATSGTLHNG